jgi:ribonuclease E
VDLVVIPNRHLETPAYEIQRLRSGASTEEEPQRPSYGLVREEEPSRSAPPRESQPGSAQSPVIRDFMPSSPAPTTTPRPAGGFFRRFLSILTGSHAEESAPEGQPAPSATSEQNRTRPPRPVRGHSSRQQEAPRRSNDSRQSPREAQSRNTPPPSQETRTPADSQRRDSQKRSSSRRRRSRRSEGTASPETGRSANGSERSADQEHARATSETAMRPAAIAIESQRDDRESIDLRPRETEPEFTPERHSDQGPAQEPSARSARTVRSPRTTGPDAYEPPIVTPQAEDERYSPPLSAVTDESPVSTRAAAADTDGSDPDDASPGEDTAVPGNNPAVRRVARRRGRGRRDKRYAAPRTSSDSSSPAGGSSAERGDASPAMPPHDEIGAARESSQIDRLESVPD